MRQDTPKIGRIFNAETEKDTRKSSRISDIDTAEISAFAHAHFSPVPYRDSMNRWQATYLMTEEGFAFLVMVFTGARAAVWKIRYGQVYQRSGLA